MVGKLNGGKGKGYFVLIGIMVTLLVACTLSGAGGGEAEEVPAAPIETDLPQTEISTLDSPNSLGSNTSLQAQIDGFLDEKPVFLFFYSDWCHFCHQQMPIIDELEKEAGEKLAFIRINADERPEDAETFGVSAYPTMFVITGKNEAGYIKQELSGFTGEVELRERIASGSAPKSEAITPDRVVAGDVAVTETSSTCDSCVDCTEKLNKGGYDTVILAQDILNHSGNCITMTTDNAAFDCAGHSIGGNWPFDVDYGIKITGDNNVVTNCNIGLFWYGIWLDSAHGNIVTKNNMALNGYAGLTLTNSDDNEITSNTMNFNSYGLTIVYSDNTVIDSNGACANLIADIWQANSTGNTGSNNTCYNAHNWNDTGTVDCTNLCCLVPTDNMRIEKDTKFCPGTYSINDTGDPGIIIINHSDVTLDCNNASLIGNHSGVGIYNDGFDNVTIKNCNISSYSAGIYLRNLERNTLDNNRVTGNNNYGISLDYVNDSSLTYNTARYNNDGISLWHSSNNHLQWNEACANIESDIRVLSGQDNSGDWNECNVTEDWNDRETSGCTYACQVCDDWDEDGVCDDVDNCRFDPNPDQADGDGIRENDLVSYWRFDEGSGTNASDSVGSYHGTLVNSPGWTTGMIGSALDFDGANDYVSTPLDIDQSGSSNVTMQMWVYPTSTSSGRHQVLCSDNGGHDWSVLRDGGTWQVFTGELSRSTGFSVDLNTWQHLAAVFIPGTGVKFYKNGVEAFIPHIDYDTSDTTLEIGRNAYYVEYFAGTIDEVAVYDTALTTAEIQELYSRGLSGHDYLGDGIGSICDNCPNVYNPDQADWLDIDGFGDACDNCWSTDNPDQNDTDGDCASLTLDASYWDGTKWLQDPHCGDLCDNCPEVSNPDQNDTDSDLRGDVCDNCWYEVNTYQEDTDGDCTLLKLNYTYWDGWLQDPHCGDECDNCWNTSNPNQENSDSDARGDACDNCDDDNNPSQTDWDKDGVGDACDNCWDVPNPDQKDWNNDGLGDACDCWDGFKGPNETGADCGGICVKACSACIPLIKNGATGDKINVVFVPDKDYQSNMTKFFNDVLFLINSGYFGASEINNSKCKFNFYYYPHEGEYVPVCSKWNLPKSYSSDCSFAATSVIVFTNRSKRACSSGNVLSTDNNDARTVVHESGHNIFDMKDEYCCDGAYYQLATLPNIYSSNANCQALSSNPAGCFEFCPTIKCWPNTAAEEQNCKNWYLNSNWPWAANYSCNCTEYANITGMDPSKCTAIASGNCPGVWHGYWQTRGVVNMNALTIQSPNWCNYRGSGVKQCCGSGWWKSDPNSCYMVSGNVFEPDCHARVMDKLNSIKACTNPGTTAFGSSPLSLLEEEDMTKVVILDYNIRGSEITLLDSRIVYNEPPNHFKEYGAFQVSALSSQNEELRSIVLEDPREFRLANVENFEQGIMMGDDVNFTVILPFIDLLKTVEMRDFETTALIHTADLSEVVLDFCQGVGYNDTQCLISDLDDDGVTDREDNCPVTANPDQTDSDEDGIGDVCEEGPKVCEVPTDDFYVNSDMVLCPGWYDITDSGANGVIIINASNVVLDGNGAILNGSGAGYGIYNPGFDNVVITNITILNYDRGIFLRDSSDYNRIQNSNLSANDEYGIELFSSIGTNITENVFASNGLHGILLFASDTNTLTGNLITGNSYGVYVFDSSDSNEMTNNEITDNLNTGVYISDCDPWGWCPAGNANNYLGQNVIVDNGNYGIYSQASNTTIEGNTVCDNGLLDFGSGDWLASSGDENICDMPNGWDDTGTTGCTYSCEISPARFDTGPGSYPSIAGTHTGTITPETDMTVSTLYTYPSAGTGGHSVSVHIWGNGVDKNASWGGYSSDWQNISFDAPVVLEANETYYYSITTGSYPQIIHSPEFDALGGTITCTEFIDLNGRTYNNRIPAIRLE